MGSQQSKGAASHGEDKAMVERLRRMKLQKSESSFEVNEKFATYSPVAREAEGLSLDAVTAIPTQFLEDPRNRLALTALSSSDPRAVLISQASKIANQHIFNTKIPFEGAPITNQRSSGRCWLFAATNVFRVALMKKYNLESFELSQAYLYYYDKLEKSNWFLEQIIDTAGEDLEGRLVQRLLDDLISDGGQWDMVYNLVEKYGLVPQSLYPDSWNAKNSSTLNTILKTKLREFALSLRRAAQKGDVSSAVVSALKGKMMVEIQHIITLLLGPTPNPTEEFTWTYTDKDGKAHELTSTPKEFAKNLSSPGFQIASSTISNMVSLVNDPRNDYFSLLTVDRLGNVVGGRNTTYINVDLGTLKAACIKMIKAGLPIFFGCDVGKFSDRASGVMDIDIFDYEVGLGTGLLGMTKEERLRAGESLMTHAMVLTAVHLDEQGKPVRWRVQNSWGSENGDKGWFVMSDAWMDEWVYQAVVDQKFLSKEVRDVKGQDPIVLPLWDPMGSLA